MFTLVNNEHQIERKMEYRSERSIGLFVNEKQCLGKQNGVSNKNLPNETIFRHLLSGNTYKNWFFDSFFVLHCCNA